MVDLKVGTAVDSDSVTVEDETSSIYSSMSSSGSEDGEEEAKNGSAVEGYEADQDEDEDECSLMDYEDDNGRDNTPSAVGDHSFDNSSWRDVRKRSLSQAYPGQRRDGDKYDDDDGTTTASTSSLSCSSSSSSSVRSSSLKRATTTGTPTMPDGDQQPRFFGFVSHMTSAQFDQAQAATQSSFSYPTTPAATTQYVLPQTVTPTMATTTKSTTSASYRLADEDTPVDTILQSALWNKRRRLLDPYVAPLSLLSAKSTYCPRRREVAESDIASVNNVASSTSTSTSSSGNSMAASASSLTRDASASAALDLESAFTTPLLWQVSTRCLPMEHALELSTKPHLIIEASPPYRVLHANAAFQRLVALQDEPKAAKAVADAAVVSEEDDMFLPSTSTSTTLSSLSERILSVFGENRVVTMYPVCATKQCTIPRHYLVEVSASLSTLAATTGTPTAVAAPGARLASSRAQPAPASTIRPLSFRLGDQPALAVA